ncbi:MAG: sulfite exporter TauE/SafE family protein [Spirochaetales bacterium]|nr:sulfite exporter TauE/SafE family protein [Spirochaetales bacterium]
MKNGPVEGIKKSFGKILGTKGESIPPAADGNERARFVIEGMTCSGCERRIETAVRRLPGVTAATAGYAHGTATVDFEPDRVSREQIRLAIEALDYRAVTDPNALEGALKTAVGPDKSPPKRKREGFSALQLAGIAVIIAAVWLILDRAGIFNAIPAVNEKMGYGLIFIVGLLTSVHCVAMCGGINLSQSAKARPESGGNVRKRLLPGLLYNLGRLISYTVIGGLVGALGSVLSMTGATQGVIVAVAGLFMIVMGVNMLGVFPFLRKLTPRLPKALTGKLAGAVSGKGPLLVGLANGFMPCGPLQSMQLYALSTGGFIAGATSMGLFALGTIPLMFGVGALASLLSHKFQTRMMKISALVVLFMGVLMIGRGFNLFGLTAAVNGSSSANNIARLTADGQEVSSKVYSGSYEGIAVQKGRTVRWRLEVEPSELNGCNETIVIPQLNIRKTLKAGTNLVEFLPENSGTISFTCWMGMISSSISVVDDVKTVTAGDIQTADPNAPPGCCAGSVTGGDGGGLYGPSNAFTAPFKVYPGAFQFAALKDGVQELRITIDD